MQVKIPSACDVIWFNLSDYIDFVLAELETLRWSMDTVDLLAPLSLGVLVRFHGYASNLNLRNSFI